MNSGTQKGKEWPRQTSKFGPKMIVVAVFLLALWLSGGFALFGSLFSTRSQFDELISAVFVLAYCLISPITIALLIYMLGIGLTMCGFASIGTNLILASQSPHQFTQALFNTVHLKMPDWATTVFIGGSSMCCLRWVVSMKRINSCVRPSIK
jgi:hypothetical protein